jgi:hypothetical protein
VAVELANLRRQALPQRDDGQSRLIAIEVMMQARPQHGEKETQLPGPAG